MFRHDSPRLSQVKNPAYHLRPNKAVDRLTLIDSLKRIAKLSDLANYTYYGMGGPYLEDFRLLYEFYPEIRMVSFEDKPETFKRQIFHAPCRPARLKLEKIQFRSFLTQYDPRGEKSIFWLDFTGLEYGNFEDFMTLLGKVAEKSVIKITLRAEPRDYFDKPEEFRKKFAAIMPNPDADLPRNADAFASLVQEMIQIASQQVLSSAMPLEFQPISSFRYSDGTNMLTLTGIVCLRSQRARVRGAFASWELANLDWHGPTLIDVPVLSTKERLHLQRRLPQRLNAGKTLRLSLGYLIDDDIPRTEIRLQQYADFHRYFPYFMKAVP
jgi:hypothetical protein